MKVSVSKSELKGKVSAPSSKSYTIRGLMCAALARGKSELISPLASDDTQAALNVLSQIGTKVRQKNNLWEVAGGSFCKPEGGLFCGDSAATLRFMTAICSLVPGRCRLLAGPSLSRRPVGPLIEALKKLGVNCSSEDGVAPVTVEGGNLEGGVTELRGDISSQFISALLLVSPLARKSVKIRLTTPPESKPYILMTLGCLKQFEVKVDYSLDLREFEVSKQVYHPTSYRVEGDWSSASYFLTLGAMVGEIWVENLNPDSLQGDRVLLNLLKDAGAQIRVGEDSVKVSKSKLNAIKADLSDSIDLLPTLAVLAAVAQGVSEFSGIERARLKESNRVVALSEGLKRMGIEVTEEKDRLLITGGEPKGSTIDSQGDHRIAMAFSLLGLVTGETVINDAECVSKTYPDFWDTLGSIGGKVKLDGR